MARIWVLVLTGKLTLWSVPQSVLDDLKTFLATAEAIFAQLESPDRTSVITTEANRIFGELIAQMRFIKDRYFKTPPLLAEDFTSLELNVPDTTRTPRGAPRAQTTAEIHRSGVDMLILAYKYAEGTEHLANPHTDVSRQLRWGLLPPPGVEPTGTDLTKAPADPLELPNVIDTHRRTDIINFAVGSSGKTAYFCIRFHNGKSDYGPWCSLFSAVIP
jgi:hypothetical protein